MKPNFKRLSLFYILLFFIGQNNFVLTNILAINQGLGIGKLRAAILIAFIILGIFLTFFRFLFNKSLFQIRVSPIEIFSFFLPLTLIYFHISLDYVKDGKVDFIGVAPLIEGIFFMIYFFLNVRGEIRLTYNNIKWLSLFIFFNISCEIMLYFNDVLAGVSYGPFRANVAGIEINRNPSFFYPIFAFGVLRFSQLGTRIKTFYSVIFFIYVLTLFYRTLYVALLFPAFIEFFRFGMNFSIKKIGKLFLLFSFTFLGVILVDAKFQSEFDFSIVEVFLGRFTSTFTDYSEDNAQSDRISQIPNMVYSIISNPFGIGFSGLVKGSEVYNYAFYFLHPLLYLGISFSLIYFIILKRVLVIFKLGFSDLKNRILLFCLSYFFVILVFFPYMNYFTFLSVMLLLIQISGVHVQYFKKL